MSIILESIVPVIQKAKHVSINNKKLESFCSRYEELSQPFKSPAKAIKLNLSDRLQLNLVYNSANFCYWGDPKWTVNYDGNEIGGAYGMKAAFNRGLSEGYPLLDASYLEYISNKDFGKITRGNVQVPLLQERILNLRQLGLILNKKYEGKAINLVFNGEGDSMKLLKEITENFPCYNDAAIYHEYKILFHKRAQLFVHNTHKILNSQGIGLSNIDKLTALADYKVPQLLRNKGILKYSKSLAQRVDSYQIIPAGSLEEVEIRAFTLEAVERIAVKLKGRFPNLKVIDLDRGLYLESKNVSPNDKPHHRALTTAH